MPFHPDVRTRPAAVRPVEGQRKADRLRAAQPDRHAGCHAARRADAAQSVAADADVGRSEEHTSELQSLMRISYAVFCLKKKTYISNNTTHRIYYTQQSSKSVITKL